MTNVLRAALGACALVAATAMVPAVTHAAVSSHTAPGVLDPNCNGGSGEVLHVPNVSNVEGYRAIALSSGEIVVGVAYSWSSSEAKSPPFVLEAINPDCTPDLGFGAGGTEDLRWPGNFYGMPEAMTPSVDGGIFIFGGSNGKLIATKLTASGGIDRSFADHGWLIRDLPGFRPSLDLNPEVGALVQERDGTILLGSSNGAAHCCTIPRVYAFTALGRLKWFYAPNARPSSSVLPVGSEIGQLVPLANGTIAIFAENVFGGCGTLELAAVDARGHLERVVSAALQRAVASLPTNSYNWADGYAGRSGALTLVGGVEVNCDGSSSPRGFLLHLRPNGKPLGARYTWLSPRPAGWYSFGIALPDGGFIASTTNVQGDVLALHEYSAQGVMRTSFGHDGTLSLRSCGWDDFRGNCQLIGVGAGTFLPGPSGDFDTLVSRPQGLTLFEVGR